MRKEGDAVLGAQNLLLLQHIEVLCKGIKRPGIHSLWHCFHVGLLCSTMHTLERSVGYQEEKRSNGKNTKVGMCSFYIHIFLNKMFI